MVFGEVIQAAWGSGERGIGAKGSGVFAMT